MKRLAGTWVGVLALALAAACGGSGTLPTGGVPPASGSPITPGSSVAGPAASEPAASEPSASGVAGSPEPERTLPPYTPAAVVERDTDGDGANDEFTFTFPAEQLAENLSLVRTLALAAEGADAKLTLNLRYENSGSVPIKLTHRIVIPKEFAKSVDDLTMSVPFARVVNPDPEGDLEIDVGVGQVVDVVVEANTRMEEPDARKWKERVATFALIFGLGSCATLFDPDRYGACVLTMVRHFKGHAPDGEIQAACGGSGVTPVPLPAGSFYGAACRAVATGTASSCREITGDAAELEEDLCEGYLAEAQCTADSVSDPDDCFFDKALAGGSLFACAGIEDATLKIVCNAGVTGRVEYCKRLGDDKDRVAACTEFVLAGKSGPLTPAEWLGDAGADGSADAPPVEDVDTAWFPVGEQDAICQGLGSVLPGWTIKQTEVKGRNVSQFGCIFETFKLDDEFIQGHKTQDRQKNPAILVFPSEAEAKAQFQKCCGENPPGASVPESKTDIEAKVDWSPSGDRMTAALGFSFDDVHGRYSRWADEHTVVERYRNCLIGVVTNVSNHVGLRSTEQPPPLPPLSNEVDAQTEDLIQALRLIVDGKLEQ